VQWLRPPKLCADIFNRNVQFELQSRRTGTPKKSPLVYITLAITFGTVFYALEQIFVSVYYPGQHLYTPQNMISTPRIAHALSRVKLSIYPPTHTIYLFSLQIRKLSGIFDNARVLWFCIRTEDEIWRREEKKNKVRSKNTPTTSDIRFSPTIDMNGCTVQSMMKN